MIDDSTDTPYYIKAGNIVTVLSSVKMAADLAALQAELAATREEVKTLTAKLESAPK